MHQFLLDLPTEDPYKLDNFIISASNKRAYDAIVNFTNSFGVMPYENTVLIYGPKSCGKTFLSKIFQDASGGKIIDYSLFQQNVSERENLIEYSEKLDFNLAHNRPDNNCETSYDIIQKFPAFILEDIEDWNEKDLLHYFNLANENKKFLLLTSKNQYINFKINDLRSRINSILKIELCPPDEELIKILLFKIFSAHSIKLNPKILEFLIKRLPRDFNEITKLAHEIIAHSLEFNKKVSVNLAKNILSSL